jgi:hypothetical protein
VLGDVEALRDVVGREVVVQEQEHLDLARREHLRDRVGHAAAEVAPGAHLLEQPASDLSGESRFAVRHAAQEGDDPLGRLALQQVTRGAPANRGEQVLLGSGSRQDHDLAAGSRRAEERQRRETVDPGHREVE